MSDYFTRLAERALGVTAVPRPVIPSRFERAGGSEFDEITIEEEPGPASTSTALHPMEPGQGSPAAPVPTLPDPGRAPLARERAGSRDPELHPQPGPVTAARESPAAIERTIERLVVRETERVPPEPRTVAHHPPDPVSPAGPATPAPVARVETRTFVPQPPAPPAIRAERQRDTDSEPAPAVHVTIGRVDVRAVTPPAPPARERTRPPGRARPSLEDYLGNGRDRR